MSNPGEDELSIQRRLKADREGLRSVTGTLINTGGDGTSGGMEARIAKLEADVGHLVKQADRLADVPADLAIVKTRIDSLPDKDWVGEKLRHWLGGAVAFLTAVTLAAKFIHFS